MASIVILNEHLILNVDLVLPQTDRGSRRCHLAEPGHLYLLVRVVSKWDCCGAVIFSIAMAKQAEGNSRRAI